MRSLSLPDFVRFRISLFLGFSASHFGFPASPSLHLRDLGLPMCYFGKVQFEMFVGISRVAVGVYAPHFGVSRFAISYCREVLVRSIFEVFRLTVRADGFHMPLPTFDCPCD